MDEGHVGFEDVAGVVHDYGDNCAAALLGDLKASLMEIEERRVCLVPGALGLNRD